MRIIIRSEKKKLEKFSSNGVGGTTNRVALAALVFYPSSSRRSHARVRIYDFHRSGAHAGRPRDFRRPARGARFFPAGNEARSRFRRTRAACAPAPSVRPRPSSGGACAARTVPMRPTPGPGDHAAPRAPAPCRGGRECHARVGGRPRTMKAARFASRSTGVPCGRPRVDDGTVTTATVYAPNGVFRRRRDDYDRFVFFFRLKRGPIANTLFLFFFFLRTNPLFFFF